MSDVFISYKREDRPRAKQIARRLKEEGFSVWWDRKIPPGKSFERVIQEALDQATCVLVLWSELSVQSDWVKEEAEKGKSRGTLVPVLIDEVEIPLGFGRIQTANLVGWNGEASHREFAQLSASVARMIAGSNRTFQVVRENLLGPDFLEDSVNVTPSPELRPRVTEPARHSPQQSSPRQSSPRQSSPRQSSARQGSRAILWAAALALIAVAVGGAGFFFGRTGLVSLLPGSQEAVGPAAPSAQAEEAEPSAAGPEGGDAQAGPVTSEPPDVEVQQEQVAQEIPAPATSPTPEIPAPAPVETS